MDISSIAALSGTSTTVGNADQTKAIAAEFETMFYRTLLQSTQWIAAPGGNGAELGALTGMLPDFFAQEAAKQQAGFGALLLQALETQRRGE